MLKLLVLNLVLWALNLLSRYVRAASLPNKDEIQKAIERLRQEVFGHRVSRQVDQAINEYRKEMPPVEEEDLFETEIIEHPIDDTKQTGASRLLGGPIEIRLKE